MTVAAVERVRFWPGSSETPALSGASIQIAEGEIVLVRGPSGCGKTTLLRTIAGLVPHFHGGTFEGRVVVDGLDTRRTPVGRLSAVVGSVFQDPETQAVRATVAGDVAFGLENTATPPDDIGPKVARALSLVDAGHLADRRIATLSGGERQRAAIAAAIATEPRILLLDEPTSQLDDASTARLMRTLRALAREGTAVVIAEHHIERLGELADRTVAMRQGRIVADVPDPEAVAPTPAPAGPVALTATGIVAGYGDRPVLDGCSLELRTGRVVAVCGPNGCGKSTLLRAIAGLVPLAAGRMATAGVDLTGLAAEERARHVAFLPQDGGRRLIRERVRDEVTDGHGPAACSDPADLLARFDLTDLAERHPMDLSVGERERVAIANVVGRRSGVVLLDEPSRGMDHEHRDRLAAILRAEAAAGRAVVVATHDPAFTRAVADEVLDMADGRLGTRAPATVAI